MGLEKNKRYICIVSRYHIKYKYLQTNIKYLKRFIIQVIQILNFIDSYNKLFLNQKEYTKEDYMQNILLSCYCLGSSDELKNYYKVIHNLCALGSVEKMYMPPTLDSTKSVKENQILLEKIIAKDLHVSTNNNILALGCGCGAIAKNMAKITGSNVYGINIEEYAINKALEETKKHPELKLNFIIGDFNKKLPFSNSYFDGIYDIQALTYAIDLLKLFKEVYRILKPGGYFVINDVAVLDRYKKDNLKMKELVQHSRELCGFWYYKYWEDTLKKAGFIIISSDRRSAVDMIRKEKKLYDKYNKLFGYLSRVNIVPTKVDKMMQRVNRNCNSYIKAEQQELLTLNWHFVAKKPKMEEVK